MSDKDNKKHLIPALERGLMILMELNRHHREMSFSELVKRVGYPQATSHRAVQTLEHMGFLRHHPVTGLYSLGVNVLRLGFEYVASLDVVQIGQPVIESLCEQTGCSSHIAIRDGRDAVYVARVGASNATIRRVSVGTRLPLHCTSLGRMLLTDLSREEFETLYPPDYLLDKEPGAPANRDVLWDLVQEDRQRGYVIADSYYHLVSLLLSIPSITMMALWKALSALWCPYMKSLPKSVIVYRAAWLKLPQPFPLCWVTDKFLDPFYI